MRAKDHILLRACLLLLGVRLPTFGTTLPEIEIIDFSNQRLPYLTSAA